MILYRTRLPSQQPRAGQRCTSSRTRLVIGAVMGLLCVHFVLAVTSVRHKSVTFDEVAHVTAGYSYWKRNDYRLHPENGNLPQRWMTLPLVLFSADLRFPTIDAENWRRSDLWQLGDEFFHGLGNNVERMLLTARSAVAIISVALGILVFCWSRCLFGNLGGLISLVIYTFSPTLLAHGRLATSDLFTTFFFAAAVWSIWELLHSVSVARLLAGATAVSGLFLCKPSAALILPMAALLALISLTPRQTISVRWLRGRSYELTSQWSRRVCVVTVALLIGISAFASVWAAYGFRYAASSESNYEFYKFQDIETVAQRSETIGPMVQWLADHRLLPEAYLYGVAFVAAHEQRPAFLNGEYATKGWKHFFPYCLAVKTPLAVFGVLALGMASLPIGSPRCSVVHEETLSRWKLAYQLVPFAIAMLMFWTLFLGTQLNIGHRHILPTYPLMFVLAGAAARWCHKETRVFAGSLFLLLMWLVVDSLASYPHYLSYFNPLVQRDQAYRHLVDSSLDWGQDLPSLKKWLDRHSSPDEPVFLGYFGTASPAYYEIEFEPLPLLDTVDRPLQLRPGTYCISATCLQAVYGFAPGRWNRAYEARYQELTARFARSDERLDVTQRKQLDLLKARRLTTYLRHREPAAHVGYSILIYRLTAEELDLALHGHPAELDDMSWALRRALEAEREDA